MTNFKNISDNELFIRCKKYGKEALKARQIFGGLLPEVCKRRLYEKKGFDSIYEFAAKLAGLTHEQVNVYIRLERKYEDKPVLHSALVDGQISINKLVRIASIATVENQSELFAVAQKLSKAAIDVYVKDYKAEIAGGTFRTGRAGDENLKQNGLFPPENMPKSLPVQGFEQKSSGANTLNVDFEIIAALSPELKIKIKALIDKGINVSELFMVLLGTREDEIEQKKVEIARELEKIMAGRVAAGGGEPVAGNDMLLAAFSQQKSASRHIPAIVKKVIKREFGTKCGNRNCKKNADILHHQKRFAIFKTHDPRFIKPLCKGHHEIEHADDQICRRFRLAAAR